MPTIQLSDAERLAETACDVQFELYPDWSIDTLLCHSREASEVCIEVRRRMEKRVADFDICRALINARKRGRVPVRDERKRTTKGAKRAKRN